MSGIMISAVKNQRQHSCYRLDIIAVILIMITELQISDISQKLQISHIFHGQNYDAKPSK